MALYTRCNRNAANKLVNDELIVSTDRGDLLGFPVYPGAHASEILSRRHANNIRNIGCTYIPVWETCIT